MNVTLYQENIQPQSLLATGFILDTKSGLIIQNQNQAAEFLGCMPGLVDVLASGQGYLIYSIFDHNGAANYSAMAAFTALTGIAINVSDEDEVLRGPVLVIQR